MSRKINLKILLLELKEKIREFYPYFLGFYLLSVVVAVFSKTWSSFFYWPAFHRAIIFFTILFILTFKFNFRFKLKSHFKINPLKLKFKFKDFNFKPSFKIKNFYTKYSLVVIRITKNSARQTSRQLRKYFNSVYLKLKKIKRRSWLKIFIIAVMLIFSLVKQIGVIDFAILFYALISVLFILDSRYAAGAALVFLAACPFLLIFKKAVIAENSAIFAYYFLVITVVTQVRELKKEAKTKLNSEE